MIKLRRTLYIGLGGTGIRTILYLKKMFLETYGEVPGMIRFLGIDTDNGEFKKTLTLNTISNMGNIGNSNINIEDFNYDNLVTLEDNEKVKITVDNPRTEYQRNQQFFSCISPDNIYALQSLEYGAGQVRTNGRFAFICNTDTIESKLQTALNDINSPQALNDKYDLIDNATYVYLIFSLGGGTGCGTFLDMAYLVRKNLKGMQWAAIVGAAMLPEVFRAHMKSYVGRDRSNAYGALKDWDWLMNINYNSEPITLPLKNGETYTTNERPFDACILIDNKNRYNVDCKEPRHLEEMLALMLMTSIGELSVPNTSVIQNIYNSMESGIYDIKDKKAWVSGVGCCEVIIYNKELMKLYSLRAAQILITKLLNKPDSDIRDEIENWINLSEVKIKEHNAKDLSDYFIDLYTLSPMSGVLNRSTQNVYDLALAYVNTRKQDLTQKYKEKLNTIECSLRNKIISSINRGDCAIGATIDFIVGLKRKIEVYTMEMIYEIERRREFHNSINLALNEACLKLQDKYNCINPFKNFAPYEQDVYDLATHMARNECEINCKETAKNLYFKLLEQLHIYEEYLNLIKTNLESIKKNQNDNISALQKQIESEGCMFQINLTPYVLRTMDMNTDEVSSRNFINTLEGNKILDFQDMTDADIAEKIEKYTYNLKTAVGYGNMNVNDVLSSLKEDVLKNILNQVILKSYPLLPHNFLGHSMKSPSITYYVGVDDYKSSVLYKDSFFEKNVEGIKLGDVIFSNIGMKDRIIVFSQMSPIPAFAIHSVSTKCKQEYVDPYQNICFHFDNNILLEMKRTGFSLEPCEANNTMELWVKGFIYGFIKREDNTYMYKDEENGDPLTDCWTPLKKERDASYAQFKEIKGLIESQFKSQINDIVRENGVPYIEELYRKAKANYIQDFAQLECDVAEIRSDIHLSSIADLLRKEIAYIKKELSVQN